MIQIGLDNRMYLVFDNEADCDDYYKLHKHKLIGCKIACYGQYFNAIQFPKYLMQ